jgi:hypothetical protein
MRTKRSRDYNHGKDGRVGGNPRHSGKAVSNDRGDSRPRHTRRFDRLMLRSELSLLAIDAEERQKDAIEKARKDAILAVSGGLWRVEIMTQIYENYGYRWKAKGGCEYQVSFDHRPSCTEVEEAIAKLTLEHTHRGNDEALHSYDEYVIGADAFDPDQETPGEAEIREMVEYGILDEAGRQRYLARLHAGKGV